MRTLLSTVAASFLCIALVIQAQDDGKAAKGKGGPPKGGGGGGPKNLQVLTAANLQPTMQSFVQALGLADKGGCNYCHVQDRSSDEKQEKVTARMMLGMVNDLNSKFGDGKQHVTCYTCHRGDPHPKTEP